MKKSSQRSVDIEAYLSKADPEIGRLIKVVVARHGPQRITPSKRTPFQALLRAIIYQSVSRYAAEAIHKRLMEAAGGRATPQKILALPKQRLRSIGLSRAKAKYVHALSEWFVANRKAAKRLSELPDADIIAALTAIPGVGIWTANIFLLTTLRRPDIMPANDLALRRGAQVLYGSKDTVTTKFLEEKALCWQPYRSIAALYLWSVVRFGLSKADIG